MIYTDLVNFIIDQLKTTSLDPVTGGKLVPEMTNCASVQLLPSVPVYPLNQSCGRMYDDLTVSVIIRGNENHEQTLQLCDEVMNKLSFVINVVENTTKIIVITCNSSPSFIEEDDNGNFKYNINFNAKIREVL